MTAQPIRTRRPWHAWVLAAIHLFVAYQAVSGGVGLMTNTWNLPSDYLTRTPFTTWTGPGWILIALVAVPQAVAAVPALVLPGRPRLGILAGLLGGASLLLWIAVQLALLQEYFFLQPVVAAIGVVEIGVAVLWRRRLALRDRSVPTRVEVLQA
ncbi:MAG TPA: hypothetical protein VGK18_16575 [Propionicimonas sp.]|jgi:hypothetical protein|uniref:hypothetical protein n=1 Tax=Propionicimonas sp. TaxID=1955623 RepID=UPI002F3F9621